MPLLTRLLRGILKYGDPSQSAPQGGEATFRQSADAMPQIVWSAKPDGNLEYFNQRWHKYTGLDFEQSKNEGWRTALHPDDVSNCMHRWTQALAIGQPLEVDCRLLRALDGVYRWHLVRAVPVRDERGRVVRWLGTCTDIDDYKTAEREIKTLNDALARNVQQRTAQLRVSENRFQWLVEGIHDYAILMLDPEGRVASWTAAAERIKGYTEKEIVGQHFSRFYTPEDLASGRPAEHLRIAAAMGHSDEEGWRVRKDGTRFYANVQITASYDESGRLRGFSKITRDITASRLASQQLVVERRRAEDANRAKSDFLAVISHEIRTPMNAILGMAEVLGETPLNQEQRRYLDVFRNAGSNLLTLINDLLDLSKIESGLFELEEIEFDLDQVASQAIELVAAKARAKGIAVTARLAPAVQKKVVGDPNRMRQVFINLLGNAIKFTEAGEVNLAIQDAPTLAPHELEFTVSDTGIGIREKDLHAIFDDFKQADSSTTRRYGGTGLGLGISRRIVEKMGGRLTVTSTVGKGSTFHFVVRFGAASGSPPKPLEKTAAIQAPETPGASRILLVEDSADNRLLVEVYMKHTPYALTFAEDGREGVAKFRSGEFDMVLMDLQMPVMDGLTAVRMIRRIEDEAGRDPVPILALSANARSDDVRNSLEAGCNAHLSKPITKQGLLSAVSKFAVASRHGHELEAEGMDEIAELAPAYLAARRSDLPEMRRALKGGDFSGIRRLAHNIKGTGSSYGFPELSELGAEIEASSATADVAAVEDQLEEFARALDSATANRGIHVR